MKYKGLLIVLVVLFACGDDEKSANKPPVASFEFADGIDRILLDGEISTDPDSDPLAFQWTASDGNIVFGQATKGESFFKIPEGFSAKQVDVTLTVSDGASENVKTRSVDVPAFSLIRSFGLGKSLADEESNDLDYEWYLDQSNTGAHSLVNCGPASVTMAIKWFDQDFVKTIEDARNTYHASGGWWYTNDIIAYLNKYSVNNRTIVLNQMADLKAEIDAGNIAIICLDMFYVDSAVDPEHHVNKFYDTNSAGWGHFIVIKGYKEVDGTVFFETYDPYSFNNSYTAGGLKGKNRFYSSADLEAATNIWWDYAIIIERTDTPGGRKGVDVSTIVHKPGR
jgi:hypothetical protein